MNIKEERKNLVFPTSSESPDSINCKFKTARDFAIFLI